MSDHCAACHRPMYTDHTIDAITPLYPFRDREGRDVSQLGAVDWDGLNRDFGWQSAWVPWRCRRCDTEHDHRQVPDAGRVLFVTAAQALRLDRVTTWLARTLERRR